MTENLAQRFVHLRGFGFAPQGIAKLRLDHAEGGFNVAPFVIALHKPLRVEAVQMKHLLPDGRSGLLPVALRSTVALEWNVWLRVVGYYYLKVLSRQVSLIGGDFLHHEVASGGFNQALKERAIVCEAIRNLNGGDNVGSDA